MTSHPNQEQLIDYLHGELAPGEDAALLLHLEACASCRERYQDEASLSESLRSFARADERDLPPGVRACIWSAIESSESSLPAWTQRLRVWLRPIVAVPIAAALVVVALAGYGSSLHRAGTTIDAAYYLDDHAALSSVPFNEGTIVPAALFTTENADGTQ